MQVNVIDSRLGRITAFDGPDIVVGEDTPLDAMVAKVLAKLGGGKLDALNLCSHAQPGAMQFCKENLKFQTSYRLRALRGSFASANAGVYLHACSTAVRGEYKDGTLFCQQLADDIGQPVYASNACQKYTESLAGLRIDFGDWEGELKCFLPGAGSDAVRFNAYRQLYDR